MTYDKKAPFKTYSNFLFLRCECLPRKEKSKCQSLTVISMGDNEFEIDGCFLKSKSVDRLLKFLLRAKVGILTIDMKNWAEKEKKCPKVVHENGGYPSCPKEKKCKRCVAGNSGKCIICGK